MLRTVAEEMNRIIEQKKSKGRSPCRAVIQKKEEKKNNITHNNETHTNVNLMLKLGKYLSGYKNIHTFVAKSKQESMIHRQFRTECTCTVTINGKTFVCNDLREVKKKIYSCGTRSEKYEVDVIDKKTKKVNDIYLMKYTKEGPIFQKQMYSRWKEEQAKARANQLKIITLL